MRINNNIAAMNTYSRLSSAQGAQAKSLEKLSSGLRINRAGDDAAGLAISEKMRGQVKGLNQAVRNAQDGISLIQTAEGGLNETHSILQRMRELTVQSQTDTNTDDDRAALNQEFQALKSEITRIGETTQFNTKPLLSGSLKTSIANAATNLTPGTGIESITTNGAKVETGYTLQSNAAGTELTLSNAALGLEEKVTITKPTGFESKEVSFGSLGINVKVNSALAEISANNTFDVTGTGSVSLKIGANNATGDSLTVDINDMTAAGLGVDAATIATKGGADSALSSLDGAIKSVSDERAKLGAFQNRLEHSINNLTTTSENLSAAESRIRDVDMAKEMMEFTKNNILNQASTAMLAQANQMPQGVLQLLG